MSGSCIFKALGDNVKQVVNGTICMDTCQCKTIEGKTSHITGTDRLPNTCACRRIRVSHMQLCKTAHDSLVATWADNKGLTASKVCGT